MSIPFSFLFLLQLDAKSPESQPTAGATNLWWLLPIAALAAGAIWYFLNSQKPTPPASNKPSKKSPKQKKVGSEIQTSVSRIDSTGSGESGSPGVSEGASPKSKKSERKKKNRELKVDTPAPIGAKAARKSANRLNTTIASKDAVSSNSSLAMKGSVAIKGESDAKSISAPVQPVESIFVPLKELAPLRIAPPKREEPTEKKKKNQPVADKDGIIRMHREQPKTPFRYADVEPTRPTPKSNFVESSPPLSPAVPSNVATKPATILSNQRISLANIVAKTLSTKTEGGDIQASGTSDQPNQATDSSDVISTSRD